MTDVPSGSRGSHFYREEANAHIVGPKLCDRSYSLEMSCRGVFLRAP